MATVYLNRSDDEFWFMTFRQLVSLIDQWREIEKNREVLRDYIAKGGSLDAVKSGKDVRKKAQEMGEAMW